MKMIIRFGFWLCCFFCFTGIANAGFVKGIYLSQETVEDTNYFNYLIQNAKASGITTFIADLEIPSKRYQTNIALLKANNIKYIARIIMFPGGGTQEQISSSKILEKKYNLIKDAIAYGAQEIQLDYIRYSSKQPASHQNALNILKIIQTYKNRLAEEKIPLQVDVFGISSFGESKNIGQSIKLFADAQAMDTVCPMVYPSHFVPFPYHFAHPYQTVYESLEAIRDQFDDKLPMKLVPYIELSNYHYPLSHKKRLDYIYAQIQAAQDAGADGWYAWSANNYYDSLFQVLKTYPVR